MAKLDMNHPGAACATWASVLDELLVGVSHSISNRVATLAGVSDILSDESDLPPILRALADEVPRLEEGIRLLRLLAVPHDEAPEASEPTRLADDAVLLAGVHPACRSVSFVLAHRRDVPPVVARPVALTHEIVVILIAAASAASAASAVGRQEEELASVAEQATGPLVIPIQFTSDGRELAISAGALLVRAPLLIPGER
jgi:hypothetical protein